MKRGLLTYLILILMGNRLMGQNPVSDMAEVTFGTEWGYSAAFFSGHHYNFFDPEGFRVDDAHSKLSYFTNGEVSLHVGYNFNRFWNLSFLAGYSGAKDFAPVVPLTLRATRYWGENPSDDRWFAFWEAGSGICLESKPEGIVSGKLGGGYRMSLSRITKLDFMLSLKCLYTRPDIIHYGERLDAALINRNDGYLCSLNLNIGLTF